jgi:hypothetical protein
LNAGNEAAAAEVYISRVAAAIKHPRTFFPLVLCLERNRLRRTAVFY